MDVCRQWGELASDLEQKIKYAMWKATDINRAIKEGRQPKPGGADEDDGFGVGDGMGGGGGGGGGSGGVKVDAVRVQVGGSGGVAMPGGFVPGGGSGDSADTNMSQSFQQFPSRQDAMMKDDPMEEVKAPLERTQYPPTSGSTLPTSYLPSSHPAFSYPDTPPPVPPQPPLSPNTANSLGFTSPTQPFTSALSPGYSPGFLGPTSTLPTEGVPPHSSPSSSATNPSSFPSSSPPIPPPSSSRPSLPAPPGRRPGSIGPPSASDYTSSTRYSPALPSQITPSALPAVTGKSRSAAVKDAERLMKHAGSALSFDDVDTAIVKMQQAVALLYNHRTPQ